MIRTTALRTEIQAELVILAAGNSSRMGGIKKEFLPMKGGTVLSQAARAFLEAYDFERIVISFPPGNYDGAKEAFFSDPVINSLLKTTKLFFVEGGATRQASVLNSLEQLEKENAAPDSIVLIHDGARPFVSKKLILDTIAAAKKIGAAVPAIRPVDTQKEVGKDKLIKRHLVREDLAAVQTPQAFLFAPLLKAHRNALKDGCVYTDDTEIWGKYAGDVITVEGDPLNKKITYPSDIVKDMENQTKNMIRVGLGYDLHALVEGRKLFLGGVHIPFDKGEAAHSDGDVLLHAITDALLGACALGDIGSFFPPEDNKWKDADSRFLLGNVWNKISAKGWQLCNLDCVIALEKPKFLPYRDEVRRSIAAILGTDEDRIFVKAKTGEKLGKIGRGEAVEAWANCLLVQSSGISRINSISVSE
ncbi:2-C-methyl-D-erythritol 2,4-cyclodiphosphate synthase [Treponema parvum]|uniref:Bifunctional enzyme IspD/IspF n=1 Tax=Treponema parvum TaxID=138851 RepID=A0A975F3P4_9SPIR|nr:2-C-methyl-D-erythritol 2,4-cyclodiphosphate synthase [Treponema parvum]QTQ13434.1 2-C-methyl-D-erythritol 2,4-cyclodiphosphate synthase [Treponema parvum]